MKTTKQLSADDLRKVFQQIHSRQYNSVVRGLTGSRPVPQEKQIPNDQVQEDFVLEPGVDVWEYLVERGQQEDK
jgi:hypothetical protein